MGISGGDREGEGREYLKEVGALFVVACDGKLVHVNLGSAFGI